MIILFASSFGSFAEPYNAAFPLYSAVLSLIFQKSFPERKLHFSFIICPMFYFFSILVTFINTVFARLI
jgi:hypothetical protein